MTTTSRKTSWSTIGLLFLVVAALTGLQRLIEYVFPDWVSALVAVALIVLLIVALRRGWRLTA